MNPKLLAGLAAGALAAVTLTVVFSGDEASAADRTITDGFGTRKLLSSAVVVDHAQICGLSDGGCSLWAEGSTLLEDGGPGIIASRRAELSGTPLTECLDIRADALTFWKNQTGLNVNRVESDGAGTRTYLSAGAWIGCMDLQRLPDGGVRLEVEGWAPLQGGGEPFSESPEKELSGAGRTRALTVLNRSKLLWRAAEGL